MIIFKINLELYELYIAKSLFFEYIWLHIIPDMSKIIGRIQEIKILLDALSSKKSELIAVYGRRRVGKTFLVRNTYKDHIVFDVTGLHNGSMSDQIQNFNIELSKKHNSDEGEHSYTNWLQAFLYLEKYIDQLKK